MILKSKTQSILLLGGLITVAALLPDLNAVANQYENLERTLSLDTGYRRTAYSNRAITDFNLEMLQGYGYLNNAFYNWQDEIGKNDSTFSKSLWETANIGIGIIFGGFFFTPVHEFGHGSRMAAAGATPTFGYTFGSTADDSTTNIFNYYLMSLKYSFKDIYTNGWTTSDLSTQPKYLSLSALEQSEVDFFVSAGGVNIQMYSAEQMSNMIYDHGGHVSYIVPYFVSKNSSYFYAIFGDASSSNDLTNMLDYYNTTKGYNITTKDIKRDNLIALLASSTTYSILSAYYNYLNNGDPTIRPFSYNNIRLPDVYLYHTARGVSYKLDSAYQVNDSLSIPFSVEYIHRGENYTELSVGWENSFSGWSSSGKIFVSDNVSLQNSITFYLGDEFDVSLGWDHYNKDTLFGERHTLDLYDESSDEVWSKVSLKY